MAISVKESITDEKNKYKIGYQIPTNVVKMLSGQRWSDNLRNGEKAHFTRDTVQYSDDMDDLHISTH